MAVYFMNNNQRVIKVVGYEALRAVTQTQELPDDGSLLKDMLTVSAMNDDRLDDAQYMAVESYTGNKQSFDMYRIVNQRTEQNWTTFDGVQLAYYELDGAVVEDVRPKNAYINELVPRLLKGTDWALGYVDDNLPRVNTHIYYLSVKDALAKVQSVTGVEMIFKVEISGNQVTDKWVEVYERLGDKTLKRFNYGTNALTVVRETSHQDLYTALIGRGKGEEVSSAEDNAGGQAGYGRKITFRDVEWSKAKGKPLDKPKGQLFLERAEATASYGIQALNGEKLPRVGIVEFSDTEDPNVLIQQTYEALEYYARPKVLFKASVVNIGATGIGDTVTIHRHDLNIHYQTRVRKVTRNKINDNRTQVELGDVVHTSSTKKQANINSALNNLDDTIRDTARNEILPSLPSANGVNQNFYQNEEPERKRTGDLWYRDHPSLAGHTQLLMWNGEAWELLSDTSDKEQVNRRVDEQGRLLEEYSQDLTTTTELANDVSEKATQLEQNYQDVKASLEDGEVFKEEVIRDFNSVTERLSLIDGASGYINEIRRDVGNLTSSITEYEEGTAKRFNVIESDVEGTKQLVADLENETSSQFNVMSDEISAVVGKVNNIGGRNLIRNSNDMEWLPNGGANLNVSDSTRLEGGRFVNVVGGESYLKTLHTFTNKVTDVEEGETYTFSVTIHNGSDYFTNVRVNGLDAPSHTLHGHETKRLVFTGRRGSNQLQLQVRTNNSIPFHVVNPQLEKGEVATDWSPAPEDGVSKNELISEINVQADRQIFRVGDNRLMITEDTTYLDNAVIKSAHIADLAVTGAKIADASISSAKIINLDVDKITGNSTNFIKSNWNNISTQISIDDRGINVTGSDRWRRTYFNQTGFELFNGSGAYNKAGVIGYFKPNTDVADAYENVMQRGGSRHSIGIGVGESHDLTFGWTNTRANSQIHSPAMIFQSEHKRIELNSSLNAPASTQGIRLNSEQHRGDFGVQLRWNNNFRSRLVLANNTYLEARSEIHFYNYSGSRAFSMGQNNDSWRDLNMHGNSITNQSDERLKRNIMPSLKDSLGKFSKLEFKWFEYLENRGLAYGLHHGVMAQDVLKFAPEWVVEDEQGYYSLNQSAMLMDAFKAIMQLSQKVKKLEAK